MRELQLLWWSLLPPELPCLGEAGRHLNVFAHCTRVHRCELTPGCTLCFPVWGTRGAGWDWVRNALTAQSPGTGVRGEVQGWSTQLLGIGSFCSELIQCSSKLHFWGAIFYTIILLNTFFKFNLYCIFSITISSPYTTLPPAITTLLSMSMRSFSFLLSPSNS